METIKLAEINVKCYNKKMERPTHPIVPGDTIADIYDVSELRSRYARVGEACLKKGFRDSRLSGKIHSVPNGQLLLLPQYNNGRHWGDASLREVADLLTGRYESINEVKFGQLLLYGSGNLPHQELVAVKQLPVERSVRGWQAGSYILSQGSRSFEPIGVVKTENEAATLTRFESGVISLDNVLWHPETSSPDQIDKALSLAGQSLGELHGRLGMTHGDAQSKNIAYDSVTGEPIHIDLDGADSHYSDSVHLWSRMNNDIETFAAYQPIKIGRAAVDAFIDSYIEYADSGESSLTPDAISRGLSTPIKPVAYLKKRPVS